MKKFNEMFDLSLKKENELSIEKCKSTSLLSINRFLDDLSQEATSKGIKLYFEDVAGISYVGSDDGMKVNGYFWAEERSDYLGLEI